MLFNSVSQALLPPTAAIGLLEGLTFVWNTQQGVFRFPFPLHFLL